MPRSRFGSVRFRTTLAATAVVGAALVAVAISLVALPRQSLLRRLDDAVRADAQGTAIVLRRGVPADELMLPASPGSFVQIFDVDGRLLATTEPDVLFEVPVPPLPPFQTGTLDAGGDSYRVAVEPAVAPNGDVTYVLAAASIAPVDEAIGIVRRVLLVSVPALLALVALASWRITGRALRPVDQIRRQVGEISATALHRRVPEPDSDDEVAQLARTMNEMLDRLEVSAERQRRFVSDASHELRSPLATIRAQLEVARAGGRGVDWQDVSDRVLAEEERLHRLVEDLLVLARTDEAASRTTAVDVDLDELALLDAARHGDLVDTTGVTPTRVRGDRLRLASVVRNLLDNAARHATARVAIATYADGGDGVITVDDDGPGIPPGDRERVFERFTRLDAGRARNEGGAGLGLAVVKAVVSAHDGTVVADASPLGGARITVRLPSGLEPRGDR